MRPSRLGALALPLAVLATAVILPACQAKEPPVEAPAKPGRVEIKKNGFVLGYVHITPGAPGRLELSDTSSEAKYVEELWTRNKGSESVTVEGERINDDGKREHYGTIVPSTSAGYGEAVRYFFLGKGYDARMIEPAPASASAPASAPQ